MEVRPGKFGRITGGSQIDQSTQGCPSSWASRASEPTTGVFDSSREAIHDDGIHVVIDDVLNFADHASQPRRRKPTLEDRELHSSSILLADLSDSPESVRSLALSIGDVVRDQDIHTSRHDKRRVCRQIAPEMARQERGLNRWKRPPSDVSVEDRMGHLGFLVALPSLDETRPPFVAEIDATSRRLHEAVRPDLPTPEQRYNESGP